LNSHIFLARHLRWSCYEWLRIVYTLLLQDVCRNSILSGINKWKKYCDFEGGGREAAEAFVVNGTAYIGLGTPTWTVYPKDFWKLTVE
jgi:hypothetical protein